MIEKVKELKTFYIEAECEDCGGSLQSTGQLFQLQNVIQCPHICDGCGKQVMLDKQYPRQEQRIVEVFQAGERKNEDKIMEVEVNEEN